MKIPTLALTVLLLAGCASDPGPISFRETPAMEFNKPSTWEVLGDSKDRKTLYKKVKDQVGLELAQSLGDAGVKELVVSAERYRNLNLELARLDKDSPEGRVKAEALRALERTISERALEMKIALYASIK